MVTISRFSRTFNLPKGGVVACDSFHSSPAQPGSARIWASAASIPARGPAMVPLIPSGASSSVPFTCPARHTASSPGFNAAGSAKRVK